MRGRVRVTHESDSGRNQRFEDTRTGREMNRREFVQRIESGEYPNYHTRVINRVRTPASNPDSTKNNNLG